MTLVVSSERNAELELQEAELMGNRKVAGLLVATSISKANKRLRDLQQSGIAMVAFDRPSSVLIRMSCWWRTDKGRRWRCVI